MIERDIKRFFIPFVMFVIGLSVYHNVTTEYSIVKLHDSGKFYIINNRTGDIDRLCTEAIDKSETHVIHATNNPSYSDNKTYQFIYNAKEHDYDKEYPISQPKINIKRRHHVKCYEAE